MRTSRANLRDHQPPYKEPSNKRALVWNMRDTKNFRKYSYRFAAARSAMRQEQRSGFVRVVVLHLRQVQLMVGIWFSPVRTVWQEPGEEEFPQLEIGMSYRCKSEMNFRTTEARLRKESKQQSYLKALFLTETKVHMTLLYCTRKSMRNTTRRTSRSFRMSQLTI